MTDDLIREAREAAKDPTVWAAVGPRVAGLLEDLAAALERAGKERDEALDEERLSCCIVADRLRAENERLRNALTDCAAMASSGQVVLRSYSLERIWKRAFNTLARDGEAAP